MKLSEILVACSVLAVPSTVEAATLTGRVVDSAGRPVAGAEVRIWQKLLSPQAIATDQQMMFDGRDVLLTDAQGRFITPDALAGDAFARVVVEAKGMLAGRSGWMNVEKNAQVTAPDIVLKRLRGIIGRVLDRQNQPVAGATVFSSGDGNAPAETKTGRGGKFFLDGVPEGSVFLFAEKPRYHFTGLHVPSGQSDVDFTLSAADEAVAPIATLKPLVSDEEEAVIARMVIDAWLDEAARAGGAISEPLLALANFDPLAAYQRIHEGPFANDPARARLETSILRKCIERCAPPWDELRSMIESLEDQQAAGEMYLSAALRMDPLEDVRRREWLSEALLRAPKMNEPSRRTRFLAGVAHALFNADDEQRAIETISQAEKIAEEFPSIERYRSAFFWLAAAQAKHDPVRALTWLEKINDPNYAVDGTVLAIRFLPEHPDVAEDVWKRSGDRIDHARPVQLASRSNHTADFCYGMAAADLPRAERLARSATEQTLRLRGLGAIALWLAEHDPEAAHRMLEKIIRDDLPRTHLDTNFKPFDCQLATAITAAWLLPIAERIAPQLGRECFWRALALRPRLPPRDKFDDEIAGIDIQLAMMLSRYDRDVARVLLAPQIARLPELVLCGGAGDASPHARAVQGRAITETASILAAALNVDARWAAELFAGLPNGQSEPQRDFRTWVRYYFWFSTFAERGRGRWGQPGRFSFFSANYWEP